MAQPPRVISQLPRFASRRARRRARASWRQSARRASGTLALALFAMLATAGQAQQGLQMQDTIPSGQVVVPSVAPPPAPAAAGAIPGIRVDEDAPVVFTADEVEFNQQTGIVTASGRVEAWQGARFVRADTFIHDRNTGVTILRGNVELLEADGQVFYAQEAELADQFRDGVLREIRARLVQNARMAATGARRSGGQVTDMARVVYSSCNLCESDPTRPPLWQLRARLATQDRRTERISYRDAVVEVGGVPVLYTPFFSHPDPQTPRASGFLFPTFGYTRFLGAFAAIPYFWAIDDHQDLLATVTQGTQVLPNLDLLYRRRFNNGEVNLQGSIGYFERDTLRRLELYGQTQDERVGGHVAARGLFHLTENWRVGFNINRASSEAYLRTYRLDVRRVLASQVFAEGFWRTEHYARIDARSYQGLRTQDDTRLLPVVAPNAFYEYAPRQRVLGGHLTLDMGALALSRTIGSHSQRLTGRMLWERPIFGPVGDVWTVRAQTDLRGYHAGGQERSPTFRPDSNGTRGDANIRLALDWRMPLVRPVGIWGQQIIEPRVQLVTGPSTGLQTRFPNEDSVDFEFTDANLFQLDRFTGRDRQEGGTRVDAALRAAWLFPNGGRVEALAGRSFRFQDTNLFPTNSGLERRDSDWVGRGSFAPVPWFEVMGRTRLDGRSGRHRASDAIAATSLGRIGLLDNVVVTASYFDAPPQAFLTGDPGRREVGLGLGAEYRTRGGGVWRASGAMQLDLRTERPAWLTGTAGYEDECCILQAQFQRRLAFDPTTNDPYRGNTSVLFRIAFKTVGDFSLRAL
jgi:LPS-assembly protein